MFIIGITGGSGTGKTVVLRAFEALGVVTLDCDAIYHSLLSGNDELKSELSSRFTGVLQNGVIDRKRLGGIVFNDPSALLELNAITHKYIGAEIERRITEVATQGAGVAVIEAIALIESGLSEKCDVVVGITAPLNARISRIIDRDKITHEQAEARINAQKPDSFYIENCDYMLENNYQNPDEFEEKCKDFIAELLRD